jgi:hypothetical protein
LGVQNLVFTVGEEEGGREGGAICGEEEEKGGRSNPWEIRREPMRGISIEKKKRGGGGGLKWEKAGKEKDEVMASLRVLGEVQTLHSLLI